MESGGGSSSSDSVKSGSHPGCGCGGAYAIITVQVTPTTGGQFDLQVSKTESIENLKKLISKKLKVPKERICLLHRDRQLREGTLQENQLVDGSRLTLLPSVETGLLAQRPEQSVMQALESLNDSQVNDFLSGKAPLNLTMRLGDHMMLIQLQLSTVTPNTSRRSYTHSSSSSTTSVPSSSSSSSSTTTTSSSSGSSSSSGTSSPQFSLPVSSPVSQSSTRLVSSPCRNKIESTSVASDSPPRTFCPTNSSSCRTKSPCCCDPMKPTLDTQALAEASRNLTQTLKQLSSEVLTSRNDNVEKNKRERSSQPVPTVESTAAQRRQGAIIESMHHHGKGVYSGTFSGTLNPALQDKFGRPKRDISTIIHILNDLLCATPHFHQHTRQSHTITVEAMSNGTVKASTNKTAGTSEILDEAVQLSQENQATRGKMEHLRLVMEERRARRRARREARVSPYTQWSAKSETAAAMQAAPVSRENADSSMDSDNTSDLHELNPEPVVA